MVNGISILSTVSVVIAFKKIFPLPLGSVCSYKTKLHEMKEKFPTIPLPHPYIMAIYFEFKNFDPFCMSQVGAFFVKFIPKSFEFQLSVFKAFINAMTSHVFCILQAWQQDKQTKEQLNLLFSGAQISSLCFQHFLKSSRSGRVVFHKL